jgi:hypothetical protein
MDHALVQRGIDEWQLDHESGHDRRRETDEHITAISNEGAQIVPPRRLRTGSIEYPALIGSRKSQGAMSHFLYQYSS